jgi:hypothetical protein
LIPTSVKFHTYALGRCPYLDQVHAALDRGDEAAARALMLAAECAVLDAASDLFHEAARRPGTRGGGVQDGPAGRRSSG